MHYDVENWVEGDPPVERFRCTVEMPTVTSTEYLGEVKDRAAEACKSAAQYGQSTY